MGNTLINHYKGIDLKLSKSEYWDFIISMDKDSGFYPDGSTFFDDNLICYIDTNNSTCFVDGKLYSLSDYTWSDAFNNGLHLKNIGFTGIDNGIISFDKDSITDQQFIEILTGSTYQLNSGDTRLFLNAVSGNTKNFIYPVEIIDDVNDKYIRFNGGFYQGFFKSNSDYSTLPSNVNTEMTFEFILKPDLISTPIENTLNVKYPNNKGLFLYLGARAENKFSYLYDLTGHTGAYSGITTDNGIDIYNPNQYEIITDNKYVFYNRTSDGYIASDTGKTDTYSLIITDRVEPNYYTLFNRTSTGYTYHNQPNIDYLNGYNVLADTVNNAIGFIIKDDGSIGYRLINETCTGNTYVIEEEFSNQDLITHDDWQSVFIRLVMNGASDCSIGSRKFKILIYVNSKLVLVSKELPELMFRNLNDVSQKQELVPFNISIGGGTQGLADMINLSDEAVLYPLPIEENFAGSFIGDIKKFRIYYDKLDYSKILNNYIFEFGDGTSGGYVAPDVVFWITKISGFTQESNYVREKGNTDSTLHATIQIKLPYQVITGYKLYYYKNNETTYTQINGVFNIDSTGGTIEYVHSDANLKLMDVSNLKYVIEVLDIQNQVVGVKKIQNMEFKNFIFYGDASDIPTTSNEVRSLENKILGFSEMFTLNTGSLNNTFVVSIPSNYVIESVFDLDAMNVNLTDYYVKSNTLTTIKNAGGIETDYNVYVMHNAIPYTRNHRHIIRLNQI